MPNWCENKLIIRGSASTLKDFVKKYFDKNNELDFNLIIPEPQVIDDCPKDCLINDNSHVVPDDERPWFNWYEWHWKYWGTKWNSSNTTYSLNENGHVLRIYFDTAWNPPIQIFAKLVELEPSLKMRLYFLECGMCIAGFVASDGRFADYEYGTKAYSNFTYRFYNE